jgi:hypothetical protein
MGENEDPSPGRRGTLMTTATAADLRARRSEIVNQHIDAENRHDPDGVVASFHQPNYDIPRSGRPGRSTAPRECGDFGQT